MFVVETPALILGWASNLTRKLLLLAWCSCSCACCDAKGVPQNKFSILLLCPAASSCCGHSSRTGTVLPLARHCCCGHIFSAVATLLTWRSFCLLSEFELFAQRWCSGASRKAPLISISYPAAEGALLTRRWCCEPCNGTHANLNWKLGDNGRIFRESAAQW